MHVCIQNGCKATSIAGLFMHLLMPATFYDHSTEHIYMHSMMGYKIKTFRFLWLTQVIYIYTLYTYIYIIIYIYIYIYIYIATCIIIISYLPAVEVRIARIASKHVNRTAVVTILYVTPTEMSCPLSVLCNYTRSKDKKWCGRSVGNEFAHDRVWLHFKLHSSTIV